MQRPLDDYPPFVCNLGPKAMDIYDRIVGDAPLAFVDGPSDMAELVRFEVRMYLAREQLCSFPHPMIRGCTCPGCAGAGEGWGAMPDIFAEQPQVNTGEIRRQRRSATLRRTRRRHR